MSLDQRFADAMGQLAGPDFPNEIILAVSGGGDSMAMLSLAHNWSHRWGVKLWVVTIDHGLRDASADEARLVAEEARMLGWPHAVLRWNWDGAGNVMDAARRARLQLINGWRGRVRHVLLAHTRDDVAETFLMRLRREAGVDGLSAMQAGRELDPGVLKVEPDGHSPGGDSDGPMVILRPCLTMGREELRHYARTLKTPWIEDPSNSDDRFDRARIRKILAVLAQEGLGPEVLAGAAHRMADVKNALRQRAQDAWAGCGQEGSVGHAPTGEILLTRDAFATLERDTQMRLLTAALRYVSGAEYAPRRAALEGWAEAMQSGQGGTLHGCEALVYKDEIVILREYQAVRDLSHPVIWDNRWRLDRVPQDKFPGAVIRVLGDEGWALLKDAERGHLPYRRARVLPALWSADGQRLIGTPIHGDPVVQTGFALGFGEKNHLTFSRFLLSH